jgi:hypothetical protein
MAKCQVRVGVARSVEDLWIAENLRIAIRHRDVQAHELAALDLLAFDLEILGRHPHRESKSTIHGIAYAPLAAPLCA